MRLHIVFADASTRPGTLHIMNIQTQFARQSSNVRSRRDRIAMLGSANFPQLPGHAEIRRLGLRLVGRESFFLSFAFSLDCGLESQPGSMLLGHVLYRRLFDWLRLMSRCALFQREDHLADLYLLTLLYPHFFHNSANRRRNFDHGFVRFKLHHWLAFRNFVASGDHKANQISLMDVLP